MIEIYYGSELLSRTAFSNRQLFHALIEALLEVDMEINEDCHPESNWSDELSKTVQEVLKRSKF